VHHAELGFHIGYLSQEVDLFEGTVALDGDTVTPPSADTTTDPVTPDPAKPKPINGTGGNNRLNGTEEVDLLNGLDGKDRLYGGGGYDALFRNLHHTIAGELVDVL